MTFAASDSLTELVWSPHNGLNLKCAECSLADKKPFLLWNVGPRNMVPSSSQSMSCSETDDDKRVEGNLIISQAKFNLDSEIAQSVICTQSSGNSAMPMVGSSHGQNMESRDEMEGGKIVEGFLINHRSQNADSLGEADKELCNPINKHMTEMAGSQKIIDSNGSNSDMAITEALPGNPNKEISRNLNPIVHNAVVGGQILEEVTTAAEVHMEVLSEAHVTNLQKSTCLHEPTKEVKGAIEEERKNRIKAYGSVVPIVDELEYTADNNLQHPITKDAYTVGEERLLIGCSVPLETSPENGSSHPYLLKGKGKALSDGNVSDGFSNDVDDSQESVESCNSAGLLRKRQWNFEQPLIGVCKRIKKQIDGCPESASIIGQDSSFLNWISNMVNGFSKSDQEEGPSLDLTLAHSSHEHTSIIQETVMCSKHRGSESRNMGFQTIFKSLYCPSTKLLEAGVSRADCPLERLQHFVQADKTNVQSSPVSSSLQNGVSFGLNVVANEKILPPPTEVVVGHADQPWNLSVNSPIQNDSRTDSAEDNAPSKQDCFEGKNEASSFDSLGNHKTTVSENDKHHLGSDGKATYGLSNKNNLLGSLWITRFSTKTSSSSLNLNHSNRATSCPGDCTRLNPQNQTGPGFSVEEKYSDTRVNSKENSGDLGKELQTFAASAEFSSGFKEIHEHKYQHSVLKLNNLLPSQGFKSSEAMASVFARRVDALKHIIPSGSKNVATCAALTCFFCGKSGHNLWDCSGVTETELKDLLKNTSSYDWPEESPSFCIRCSQLDHWAIVCPLVSSSKQQQLENEMFSINCWNAGNEDFCSHNERTSRFLDKENHLKVATCNREEPLMNTALRNPMHTAEEFSGKRSLSSNETQKHMTSNSGENKATEHQNLPLCNLISTQNVEVPKGMFDAVRRLQVSRADILKWINSNMSLSHLEGLFLRLRLGKWETGLGGTGYYVACITVEQAGEPVKDSKTRISVNVGGIKCLVGSQYVSNRDFLEDELMVWWSRTLKSGGKVPSIEDLESKFKQRIELGL
ncbi:hypothetical protein ACH5RR_031430 [Cinchona calisaya]|uniref:CCHC-type domain-containing protein n=1 Tax=Cinchona calisaya TaxID=153742 RepID=A0ABD2YG99_9GENT